MRRSRQTAGAPGWFPIEPATTADDHAGVSSGDRGRVSDSLGLSRPSNPLRFLSVPKPSARPPLGLANQSRRLGTSPDNGDAVLGRGTIQKHRKLVTAAAGAGIRDATDTLIPLQSPRLARIASPPLSAPQQEFDADHQLLPVLAHSAAESAAAGTGSQQHGRLQRLGRQLPLPPPLHELIQTLSAGVLEQGDPMLQLDRASVVQLFMEQWQRQFDASAASFKSIAVRYEVGYRELQRMTANLPVPNELLTAFCVKALDALTPHFGAFAPIMRVAAAEIRQSIYLKPNDGLVPYFALVEYQKRQLAMRVRDRNDRERRNELLSREIEHVLATFQRFLDECARGLLRSIIREWYVVAIVHKKNAKKYIENFSAWFSSSLKMLVPRIFAAWRRHAAQRKLRAARIQLDQDARELSELQRQVDEATAERDVAQLELHAVHNDRKQLEDLVQRLTHKIQSANVFLETTQRREPLVATEGHLRVEAVSFLPPLVLESLLRGYHGLGFLQHPCDHIGSVSAGNDSAKRPDPAPCHPSEPTTTGTSAGLFARQIFAQIMDIQAQVASCEDGETTGDPSASVATDVDFAKYLSTTLRNTLRRIRGGTSDDSPAPLVKVLFANSDSAAIGIDADDLAAISAECLRLFHAMRVQDEHYVRHPKLFSTRLLESHEVSIVPTAASSAASVIPVCPSVQTESSPLITGNNDLGVINGTRRFSTAPLPASIRPPGVSATGRNNNHGLSRANSMMSAASSVRHDPVSAISNELIDETDFVMARAPLGNLVALLLARLATDYGALVFSPSDMTVFTHSPYSRIEADSARAAQSKPLTIPNGAQRAESPHVDSPKAPTKSTTSIASTGHYHRFRDLLGAYDTWNRLAEQLIKAGIVQSRGAITPGSAAVASEGVGLAAGGAMPPSAVPPASHASNGSDKPASSTNTDASSPVSSGTGAAALRPKLLHQLELLPHSALVANANTSHRTGGSPGRRSTGVGGDRLEQAAAAATRLERLEVSADVAEMTAHVNALHETVLATAEQQSDFRLARQQLRDLEQLQWSLACELAAPAPTASPSVSAPSGVTVPAAANSSSDPRPHLLECVSFDNGVMARLLSVEREPAQELERVRAVMSKHKVAFRQLYARHRATSEFALSLEELWQVVELLRLPREVHALAPLTALQTRERQLHQFGDDDDDDLFLMPGASASHHHSRSEQLFSPEDLAEALLLLCNEQFPSIPTLSARVEHFAVVHLPFAAKSSASSSARSRFSLTGVRDLLLQPEVHRALSDHAQTLRIIFRRYCAKERAVHAKTAAAALSSVSGPMALLPGVIPINGGRPAVLPLGSRAKFLRQNDWLAFVQDYHLLRARFPLERAVGVFRAVLGQDPTPQREREPSPTLEMPFAAFCEAVTAMALSFTPDPFVSPAAKLSQFISRFLPVAPEEAHDHATG